MNSTIAMLCMLPFMLIGAIMGLVYTGFISGFLSMINYLGLTALRKRKHHELLAEANKIAKGKL